MSTFIPTLSMQGWIDNVEIKADRALAYFLTSDYSQSTVYAGQIASLSYLIQQYGDNETGLEERVQDTLEAHMRRQYPDAQVDTVVNVTQPDEDNPGNLNIYLSCTLTLDGKTYVIGKSAEYLNGALKRINDINTGR